MPPPILACVLERSAEQRRDCARDLGHGARGDPELHALLERHVAWGGGASRSLVADVGVTQDARRDEAIVGLEVDVLVERAALHPAVATPRDGVDHALLEPRVARALQRHLGRVAGSFEAHSSLRAEAPVRSAREQHVDDVPVPSSLREDERGVAIMVLEVDLGADPEQDAGELRSALARGAEERRVAVRVPGVEVDAGFDQRHRDVVVVLAHRPDQGRLVALLKTHVEPPLVVQLLEQLDELGGGVTVRLGTGHRHTVSPGVAGFKHTRRPIWSGACPRRAPENPPPPCERGSNPLSSSDGGRLDPAMTLARDTHCSYCGVRYDEPLTYPRTC